MPFKIAARVAVALVVLAVPADALAAGTVRTSSVDGSLVVPAGHAATIRLDCPQTSVALNAAIVRKGAGVVVRRSVPGRDAGSWAFRVAAKGSGSRRVRAVLRCLRLAMPAGLSGTRLDVKTRHKPVVVAANGRASARLGCGRAWSATGYGLDGGSSANVRLTTVAPRAHSWEFELENTGSSGARASVSVRCIRREVRASRAGGGTAVLRFGMARRARGVVLPAGSGTFGDRCGGNRFSVATGFSIDPADSVRVALTSPVGPRAGRWSYRGASATSTAQSFLVCISRGSRFR